ncbi:unnamed protein product [Linum trigynum]|uniref:RanBP2-type domain-containing protein n=1 Tax=Linum trigynum TaxID=586398 RepID=A0AAV2CDG5_9ROSI
MAASRLSVFGTALFQKATVPRLKFAFPVAPSPSAKPLQFQHSCSTTAAADVQSTAESLNPHPWPEWVSFVDRLKTKGYILEAKQPVIDQTTEVTTTGKDDELAYRDMNQVKDACLSFGRDRYDIFNSLSEPDIQTLVDSGCPNLLRKAVNSAKRLRAYLRLDEGDVCGACNLRGSCDRAYIILKDKEAEARTVDLVRIILFYALDPLVISDGQRPAGRENVEGAARKLLSEMVELSERTAAPEPLKPAATKSGNRKIQFVHEADDKTATKSGNRKIQFVHDADDKTSNGMATKGSNRKAKFIREAGDKASNSFGGGQRSEDVEMKRGDWMCPKCNFLNFARNKRCLKCKEEGPKSTVSSDMEMKKGDWLCSECNFMNFARNISCRQCNVERPKRVGVNDVVMKKGDWTCPQCEFMNFASNKACLSCKGTRPKIVIGEWECSCGFLNYSRNAACLKCKTDRPTPKGLLTAKMGSADFVEQSAADYEEWRRPQ